MVLPTAVDKLGEGGNHFQIKNSLILTHIGTFLNDSGHFRYVALESTQLDSANDLFWNRSSLSKLHQRASLYI